MSRFTRLIAMAAVLLLALCACDVLFMGRYSSDLGQATVYLDLSKEVSAYAAPSFNLSIVPYGESDYVLLFSAMGFDSSKGHLYVFSPELKLLNTYTLDDIAALNPNTTAFAGDTAMTQLTNGTIIIGNIVATPTMDAGLTLMQKTASAFGTNAIMQGWAIEGPSGLDYTCTDFRTDDPSSQTLTYQAYPADWNGSSTIPCPLGKSARIQGVFSDPTDRESNLTILAFTVDGEEATYFFQVAKDPDLANGFSGNALFTDYASFTKQNLRRGTIAVTDDGIVAYDESTHSWIWFTPSDYENVKSLPVGNWDTDQDRSKKAVFSFANGWYCVWDPDRRTLTRYEKWW